MKHILFILLTAISLNLSAQFDTINQVNSKGKKNGYWKVFLDSQAYPTDSINAYFYGYNFHDNGTKVFSYADRNKTWHEYRFVYGGTLPVKGSPLPIEGSFQWFDSLNRLMEVEIYKEGKPVFWESTQYMRSTNGATFKESLYFDKLYNNQSGTFYYTEGFSDSPHVAEYWFRKGKKGWKSYKIK